MASSATFFGCSIGPAGRRRIRWLSCEQSAMEWRRRRCRWRKPPSSFGIERDGVPIESYGIRHPVRTGITYGVFIDGYVPEYEEREAAVYCNYTPTAFRELPVEERARCVAQFRLHHIVSNNIEDAQNRAAEQAARKPG